MKSFRKEKTRRPMSLSKKIVLCVLAAALVIGGIYLTYYVIHYYAYDRYKDFLTDQNYEYEEGTVFQAQGEAVSHVDGMELVSENDTLKLYTNTATAEIAIYDKRNGEIIYSNPMDPDSDSIANAANINYMKSQFILSYYNQDVKQGTFDSYTMSVEKGQVEAQGIERGIRYLYKVGDFSTSKTGNIALYMTPEKLEKLTSRLSESEANSLRRYYSASSKAEGMLEFNSVASQNVKIIAKVKGWLDNAGWTDADYEEQMALAGVEADLPISFLIPLEYRLEEDGLEVSIPVSGIEEYGGGKLFKIQLLRYMGAASTQEEGYLVVPNGSGSLINFNNGKVTAASYSQYIYDLDPVSANYTTMENTQDARLPLFGICRQDSSLLATVEEGKTIAMITAGVSGVYSDYNYAYPTFTLRNADNLLMFGDASTDVYVLEEEAYDVNLTVRYTLLDQENKGYAGLANYYRDRLIAEGDLQTITENADIPFYYDVIGGVKETSHFLGVQYLRTFSMTTFAQAMSMQEEFASRGITHQVVNFQGWMNGGYYHDAAHNIKVLRKLGGKSELEDLSQTVQEDGGRFYADVAFQKVTFADRGFNYEAESSHYYGAGYVVNFGMTNPTTLRATSGLGYHENRYDLLSPKFLPRYIDKFSNKIERYDIGGIALRDLGNTLQSDKKRTNIIDREQALQVVIGQWDTLLQTEKNLLADGANSYAFGYLTDIINVPVTHNNFPITDESIPLYQMIVHGCIDYSTELLNFYDKEDMTEIVLGMIESGSSPHYVFTWEESSRMKNTALNWYYSTTFDVWKEEAAEIYGQVNEALKYVSGAQMVDHEIYENGVRKVTYSNGVKIYVNYSTEVQTAEGLEIPAGSYRLEGN